MSSRRLRFLLVLTLLSFACVRSAVAGPLWNVSTVDEHGADAGVTASNLTANYGKSPAIKVQQGSGTQVFKMYMRFPLGSGPDGQIGSATLNLNFKSLTGNPSLRLYGLTDGVAGDGSPANGQGWNEGNLSGGSTGDDVLKWQNAPALRQTSPWAFTSDAVLLDSFQPTGTGAQSFLLPSLANFLRTDSNGFVTLMLESTNSSAAEIYTRNFGDGSSAPSITITTIPTPEPSTMALLATGALGLYVTRRRWRGSSTC